MHVRRILIGGTTVAASLATLAIGSTADASSGNGIASKSATTIVNTAVKTTKSATSFTLNGAVKQGNSKVAFTNFTLSNSGNAHGTVTYGGQTLHIIEANHVIYVSAPKSFWLTETNSQALANLMADKWMYGGSSNQGLTSLAQALSAQNLLSQFGQVPINTSGTTLRKGSITKVAGQRVIPVYVKKGGGVGAIYVATTGKPYMVRLTMTSGSQSGRLTFTNYNRRVSAKPPKNALNLNQLEHTTTS